MTNTVKILTELEQKARWLSAWTIHNANHLREKPEDSVKVGGHQASCASMSAIMTALYFAVLRPEDRVAVKPHASPVFHAIQYLLNNQTLENIQNFRSYGGAQSYPSRTKDSDDVDFSTGSVGLGVAMTAFAAMVQDYVRAKPWAKSTTAEPEGSMIALVGDAELDEGNIYECLQEGWKHDLRNTWWVIDYNRQSLDGVVREGLYDRIAGIFETFGWDVVELKYGALQQDAFQEQGGEHLQNWIDNCPNQLYSALSFLGGAAWRKRLQSDIGMHNGTAELLAKRDDDEIAALMSNLGGHCITSLLNAFNGIDHDRPVVFIAYTIKGWGTPLAGHKDNHAGLMSVQQMEEFRSQMNISDGGEWDKFDGLESNPKTLQAFLDTVPFNQKGPRRHKSAMIDTPDLLVPQDIEISTQMGFGKILDALAKGDSELSDRILTTSPDVTVSTNLGPWVNRRELFATKKQADTFREEKIPSMQKWQFSPEGQHMELGIAEMNLFLLLGAAGLSHSLFGERLLPIGTLYDPFISRGLDALNYACYQDARFMLVATPSGVSLAPEGGAHQSIATPLIGMSQDGLASFEPAFVDELSIIMTWAFDYMQKSGDVKEGPDSRTWLRDEAGGSVYLRLSTRSLEQPKRQLTESFRQNVIDGAYWHRKPSPNCDVVIAYQGALASEAISAAGIIGQDRRDVGVLAITSADRLNAGWHAAQKARMNGLPDAKSHVENILADIPPHCTIITVLDGHPATLSWLGGVRGHKTVGLGVEHFGQTGTVQDLYRHFGIDTQSIIKTASSLSPGRPIRLIAGGE